MQTQRNTEQVVNSRYTPSTQQEDLVQIDIDGQTLWVTLAQQNQVLEALREAEVPNVIYSPERPAWVLPAVRWGALVGIAGAGVAVILPPALEASARWFNRVGLAAQQFTDGLVLFLAGVAIPAIITVAVLCLLWYWVSRPGEPDVDYQTPAPPAAPSAPTVINNVTNNFINNPNPHSNA